MTKYKFMYQSRLQWFCFYISLIGGMLIVPLPAYLIFNYIASFDFDFLPPQFLAWAFFVLPAVLMILGAVIGFRIGKRFASTGTLQLYSDHATLEYGRKTALLHKDECSVEGGMTHGGSYAQQYWDIRFDGHKVRLYEAIKKFKAPRYDPSLGKAMRILLSSGLATPSRRVLRAIKKLEKKMGMTSSSTGKRTFKIGNVVISKRISTPAVFAGSPYYVDYSAPFAPKDEPACGCYVREVADPEHVVAEIYFEDDREHKTPKTETVLSKSAILYGVVLDIRIPLE